jgi:hypothetical protein
MYDVNADLLALDCSLLTPYRWGCPLLCYLKAEVSHEEAAKFAEENGLHFIETSAKTGQNVEEAFLKTAQLIFQNIEDVRYDCYTCGSDYLLAAPLTFIRFIRSINGGDVSGVKKGPSDVDVQKIRRGETAQDDGCKC